MDVRRIAVVAVGGASFLWLVSNVFINDIGRSWRLLDKLPEGRFLRWLFNIGVLRAKGQNEKFPPMLYVEVGLFALSCISIALGIVNLAPVYVALAGVMINYGTFMKEWCSQNHRKALASLKCEASLADGLIREICKSNELGVEASSSIILITSVTLILQACTCACYAAVIYGYTATLQHQYIARLAIESRQQTPEEMVMEEQRQRALVKRNKEARVSLVHEGSFLPLPGLITVFRGHRGNVACLKIRRVGAELRVFSGGADGTLRMWDLRTAKPLMVIKAHSLPVLGLDLLAVEAREQQQNSSEVLSRTYDPKWSSFANKFKFTIANIHQMICIHLFAATKGGDVQIGNSAVLLHEVFGTGLDAGGNVCKRDLDLPLIQLLPDRDLLQQSQKVQRSEEDVVEEMNGAGAGADAQLALLDAAVICKRGLRADLRYRKTGSVQVSIEYRAMESSLEVHVREAQIRGTKVPQKQMNAYHTVIVKVPPQLRVFTVGGSVAHMFDVQSQRLIHAFEGHTTTITCVLTRRIRACDFLFTASLDKTVRMWNIESGDTLRTFMGHLDGITSILLSHDVMQAKKVMDDRPYRGKANLVLRIKYSQNESFQMDLEVEILALEGLPLDPKAAKQLKFFARVEVSPGHLPNTEALVYKKGMWKMSRTTHHFNDVQLTAHVDITLIVRKGGRNDCYLGSIETTVAAIDRRICQEVGLDANTLTSSYPVSFDMPQQVHLFTGAGLGDGQIRQFETFPRTDSNVLPVKVFKGHSQSVTGLDFIDDVYGQRCLVSCSWDGTCKLWSVQMEDKATALETFVVADGNMHNHAVTITHYPANKSVWIVVGSNDRCVRLVKVSKKAIEAKSWRSVLAEWLDSLPVFGVIIFCIILDVSTGVVTDFAMAKHDKDCFGRDSQGSLLVTAFVLSIFCAELLLRMIAQGIDFVVPVRICFWNYLEVLLIFGSSGVAVMKAISDIRDEAPFPQGAEVPVISCNAYPELCEGYCGDFQATKELSSVTEARKGTTAARILTRFAIGLRLLRAVLMLRRLAASFLVKEVQVYNGHEGPVNALAVCEVDGSKRMVTVSEDSYIRLWDIEPL